MRVVGAVDEDLGSKPARDGERLLTQVEVSLGIKSLVLHDNRDVVDARAKQRWDVKRFAERQLAHSADVGA